MPSIPALPFIRNAISEGRSANAAYRDLQRAVKSAREEDNQAWQGMGRQAFLRLYSQTLALRSKVPNALDWDVNLKPDATVIGQRDTTRGRGYLTWLSVATREVGSTEVEGQYFVIRTNEPLSPQEAMDQAQAGFIQQQQQGHGSARGRVWVGATYTGTEQLNPVGRP